MARLRNIDDPYNLTPEWGGESGGEEYGMGTPFNPTNNSGVSGYGTSGASQGGGMFAPQQTLTPTNGAFNYGWDFGAHANTGSNLKTPKYMLSNYLIQNNIDPNSDWSQGAYDYLNGLGVKGLQTNGGRRLSFGDEFVDTTKQAGQFFWGSNPGSDQGIGGMPGSSNPYSMPTGTGVNPSGGSGFGEGLGSAFNEGILSILKAGWGADKGQLAKRYESARETIDRGRRSQMNNLNAQLAERGLLGSGAEASTIGRTESDLAGQYSTALRDATLAEDQIASDRYMGALNAALGADSNDINRKKMIGELAVANLSQNRQWNQFMLQYGLDKEKIMNDISMGNIDRYTNLIGMFLQYGQGLSQGAEN